MKLFAVRLKDGNEIIFNSLYGLTPKKRDGFFNYLRGVGIEVNE